MPGIVRAGLDYAIGTCNHPKASHPITCIVSSGSTLTDAESVKIARMVDTTENTCIYSKTGVVITGSVLTTDKGQGVARMGIDIVQFAYGVAVFIQGSTIVTSD